MSDPNVVTPPAPEPLDATETIVATFAERLEARMATAIDKIATTVTERVEAHIAQTAAATTAFKEVPEPYLPPSAHTPAPHPAALVAAAVANPPLVLPPLPSWTDAGSITSYVVTLATLIVGVLQAFGVAVPAGESSWVQVGATIAGFVVAGGVQAFNIVSHRKAVATIHAAALNAAPFTASLVSPAPGAAMSS